MINAITTTLAALNKPSYKHYTSIDPNTGKEIRDAAMENYFNGKSEGINLITAGINDGLANRNLNYKDKDFFEKNGFYSNATFELIA